MIERVTVIGAGLAGSEAAYQLAERGCIVTLFDMKPARRSPAHRSDALCELVCSNSLRSDRMENAVGLLKEELRVLGSLVMRCADATRVPAGGALAVDRDGFSRAVTDALYAHPNITVVSEECTGFPDAPAVIATGPLTDGALYAAIEKKLGQTLHFHDAAAPIVAKESLDMSVVYAASRYGRGEDYLNCPMDKAQYLAFWEALTTAETVPLHGFETPRVFEGCMPVESMAKRGERTLAFGPLKPVGLGQEGQRRPYAVVQLRQDNAAGTLYNLVGFQTNLTFPEQKRVFSMIPGLEHAAFVRYGVMHRNTFLPSPGLLNADYSLRSEPLLFFAGQITGVEGYVESVASGYLAGVSLAAKLQGRTPPVFPTATATGALGAYVSGYNGSDFQPMNIVFGLMDDPVPRIRDKMTRNRTIAENALKIVKEKQTIENSSPYRGSL